MGYLGFQLENDATMGSKRRCKINLLSLQDITINNEILCKNLFIYESRFWVLICIHILRVPIGVSTTRSFKEYSNLSVYEIFLSFRYGSNQYPVYAVLLNAGSYMTGL